MTNYNYSSQDPSKTSLHAVRNIPFAGDVCRVVARDDLVGPGAEFVSAPCIQMRMRFNSALAFGLGLGLGWWLRSRR